MLNIFIYLLKIQILTKVLINSIIFLMIIPFVNFVAVIAFFVLTIFVDIKLAKAFGKSGAFAVGLIFLPFIFQCILAFDKSEYQGIQE